jgi:hypothetical protein
MTPKEQKQVQSIAEVWTETVPAGLFRLKIHKDRFDGISQLY